MSIVFLQYYISSTRIKNTAITSNLFINQVDGFMSGLQVGGAKEL